MRFILGGNDDEMAIIATLIRAAIAAGLEAEIVEAAPGVARSEAQYASAVAPQAGDVWIECAPHNGGRAAIEAAGATRIDHHQPGDPGYGVDGFAGSSLGQLLRLLLERGVSPYAIDMWDLDDPTIITFPLGWSDCGGPYGFGFGADIPEGAPYGAPGFHWFRLPQQWEATGLADHDPVGFAAGHYGRWSATAAREFLIARAVAAGRGFTAADVAEALALIEAAPTVPSFPQVYDLRGIPELCPATLGADRQPVPGTGGRLGSAAFHAVICLPGRAALNWGAQGTRPQGRHLGLIGSTGEDFREVLASAGATGIFGAPGKACGGYVAV